MQGICEVLLIELKQFRIYEHIIDEIQIPHGKTLARTELQGKGKDRVNVRKER